MIFTRASLIQLADPLRLLECLDDLQTLDANNGYPYGGRYGNVIYCSFHHHTFTVMLSFTIKITSFHGAFKYDLAALSYEMAMLSFTTVDLPFSDSKVVCIFSLKTLF